MGKGDKKTRRGKIVMGSYGKKRLKKKKATIAEVKKTTPKAKVTPKPKAEPKPKVETKPKAEAKPKAKSETKPKAKAEAKPKTATKKAEPKKDKE